MGQGGVRVGSGGCRHVPWISLTLKSGASKLMLIFFHFSLILSFFLYLYPFYQINCLILLHIQ